MTCKFCYQEINERTGEPYLNEDGTPSMLCDINCLPIRGRLQRLVYSSICEDTPIAEILRRVQREDPSVAQSNVSRALSNLRKLGYISEGQNEEDVRVFARSIELNVEDDELTYGPEKRNPSVKMLRHLLFWVLAKQTPKTNGMCPVSDGHLTYIADIVLTEWDDGGVSDWEFSRIFEIMEPVVKKLRYIVRDLADKRFPISEAIGKAEGLDNWENRTLTPLRKSKTRNEGWVAYQPFFAEEWERLCNSGEVHPDAKRYAANKAARDVAADEAARKFVALMTQQNLK